MFAPTTEPISCNTVEAITCYNECSDCESCMVGLALGQVDPSCAKCGSCMKCVPYAEECLPKPTTEPIVCDEAGKWGQCMSECRDCVGCLEGVKDGNVDPSCARCGTCLDCAPFAEVCLSENPPTPPPVCCKAMTPTCLACAEGLSVDEFCALAPEMEGCNVKKETYECKSRKKFTDDSVYHTVEIRSAIAERRCQALCSMKANYCVGYSLLNEPTTELSVCRLSNKLCYEFSEPSWSMCEKQQNRTRRRLFKL